MTRRAALLSTALAFVGLAALLRAVPPAPGSFYPRCQLHSLTGLHCAGCGGTRAAYSLLVGDVPQALAYNAPAVLGLPLLAAYLARRAVGRGPLNFPRWAGGAALVALAAFTVLRNVPLPPFTLLAPHELPH